MLIIRCNAFAYLNSKKDNPTIPKSIKKSENKPVFPWKPPSKTLVTQSAVGIFALGFVDAGYSGDWSRIGVVSKGTEDLLKAAAFLVVPFCLFVILSFTNKHDST